MMTRATAVAAWLLVSVVLVIIRAPVVLAQSAEQQTSALTHQLMSPYCPGLLLADCRSEGALDLRAEILRRLKEGESAAAVADDLIARFGTAIRTVPAFSGVGIVVWIGPLVLGLAGFSVLVVSVRTATRHRDSDSQALDDGNLNGDGGLNERLQDELDALD
jgi:cytochrome c-type biogenesis protein CcmH